MEDSTSQMGLFCVDITSMCGCSVAMKHRSRWMFVNNLRWKFSLGGIKVGIGFGVASGLTVLFSLSASCLLEVRFACVIFSKQANSNWNAPGTCYVI